MPDDGVRSMWQLLHRASLARRGTVAFLVFAQAARCVDGPPIAAAPHLKDTIINFLDKVTLAVRMYFQVRVPRAAAVVWRHTVCT